jgi:sulfite reductase (NADPH) flavoprotein alpha-component
MLSPFKQKLIEDLIASSSREELIWINGYLAGLITSGVIPEETQDVAATPANIGRITIAYGSETGNSKKVATDFGTKAKKKGINAKVVSLEQYRLNDLPKEEYFFTVISTQGEGEPPASAKKFYDHIHQNGFQLSGMKYGVLALGDTSYPLFCKAGEDVDAQLQRLGGERIVSLLKCDIDYEQEADGWFTGLLDKLHNPGVIPQPAKAAPVKKTGKKIFTGTVLSNIILNDRGSNKQTNHIEIAADGLDYLPGDSIGIVPQNPLQVVDAIIKATAQNPENVIRFRNEQHTLFDVLRSKANIVCFPDRLVDAYAAIVKQQIPQTKIGLLDLLKIYPVKDNKQFEEVLAILEPITPRLYSISSSPEAHPGEIHLTVARDNFIINDELKYGLCSDLLCGLGEQSEINFYIHRNASFRLPEADKDVIMIGPGTGIAPFRSFLAERDATGAGGRNWLFFGDQHFESDFLYQTEIQNWLETGVLTSVNVAFSRDQKEKIYVQHRMRKHAGELFRWLENGAYLYVCGAKDPMSMDVEDTLIDIIAAEGGKGKDAEDYLNKLKEEGHYLKDVY